jgi:hypothetical protein
VRNTGHAPAQRMVWVGRANTAWFPSVNGRLGIKLLENSRFLAFRLARPLLDWRHVGTQKSELGNSGNP